MNSRKYNYQGDNNPFCLQQKWPPPNLVFCWLKNKSITNIHHKSFLLRLSLALAQICLILYLIQNLWKSTHGHIYLKVYLSKQLNTHFKQNGNVRACALGYGCGFFINVLGQLKTEHFTENAIRVAKERRSVVVTERWRQITFIHFLSFFGSTFSKFCYTEFLYWFTRYLHSLFHSLFQYLTFS